MQDLTIRRAGAGDAVLVRELTRAAYQRWVPVLGREPRPMTADYDSAVRDHVVDLCWRDGALVALVEMSLEPDHLLIVNLAVAPAEQGRALGTFLLGHAERVAREHGRDEMRLYTNRLMSANIALYLSRGYRIDREEEFMPGSFAVYLSKRLDGPGGAG